MNGRLVELALALAAAASVVAEMVKKVVFHGHDLRLDVLAVAVGKVQSLAAAMADECGDQRRCETCRHYTDLYQRSFCDRRAIWVSPAETCPLHEGR